MSTLPILKPKYVLGLDIGSSSCGWATVELDEKDEPLGLLLAGTRIFDAGVVGNEAEIQNGKDHSKASERRLARQTRRQTHRRSLRQRKLFGLLQDHKLLPLTEDGRVGKSPQQRHAILNSLDEELVSKWHGKATFSDSRFDVAQQALVYMLRAAALNQPVTLYELGRIFYHLSQRRGYWSTRLEAETLESVSEESLDQEGSTAKGKSKKKRPEEEDKRGKVAKDISDLRDAMISAHAPSLGAYLAMLNPHEGRIRHRYTDRLMFIDEFNAIWEKQKEFHPDVLTDALRAEIRYWLFFQRPLASASHLIGSCELEKDEKRAPWATLEAQRFRLLQKINDLRVIEFGKEETLSEKERSAALEHLETVGDLTFPQLKKLLGRSSIEGFNHERGKKEKLEGNRVNVEMLKVFGERWNSLSDDEKHLAVDQWRTIRKSETAEEVAKKRWGLDEYAAKLWACSNPPKDYCRLSRKALRKVLPLMENGTAYKTIERQLYHAKDSDVAPMEYVPGVLNYLPSIANPPVIRALTEMRKVVNAIIRQHGGRPYQIRIELARELRKNRKERAKQLEANIARQKKREEAARRILAEQGNRSPGPDDIRNVPGYMVDKWRLAEECRWICPYTDEAINYQKLFVQPVFEVEHIIPLSRCSDNSLANKTLCHRSENQKKGGKTPWQAYHTEEVKWARILHRVSKFADAPPKGDHPKLRRFKLRTDEEIDGFTSRQLNDTRYTSKLAARLLMALYDGRDIADSESDDTAEFRDKSKQRRIFVSTGGVTHLLRDAWSLHPDVVLAGASANTKQKGKDRSDHRHHAVDALVIALTTEAQVRAISLHAQSKEGKRWPLDYRDIVRGLQSPWRNRDEFLGDVLQLARTSHKPEHKLSRGLNEGTNYGRNRNPDKKSKPVIRQRIPVGTGLSDGDMRSIADPKIREIIQNFSEKIGGFKKWSEEKHGYPFIETHDDRRIPIRRVRIRWEGKNTTPVGKRTLPNGSKLDNTRYVDTSSKHHVTFFVSHKPSGKSAKPKEKWISECVTVYEAHQRHRNGETIIRKICAKEPQAEFICSLQKGDTVELGTDDARQDYILASIEGDGRMNFFPINAAGKRENQGNIRVREMADGLRILNLKKTYIDVLGNRSYVHESTT